jgi:hypothetical protein
MKRLTKTSKALFITAVFTLFTIPVMAGSVEHNLKNITVSGEGAADSISNTFVLDKNLIARGGNGNGGNGPGNGTGNGGSGPRDGSGNGPGTGTCINS